MSLSSFICCYYILQQFLHRYWCLFRYNVIFWAFGEQTTSLSYTSSIELTQPLSIFPFLELHIMNLAVNFWHLKHHAFVSNLTLGVCYRLATLLGTWILLGQDKLCPRCSCPRLLPLQLQWTPWRSHPNGSADLSEPRLLWVLFLYFSWHRGLSVFVLPSETFTLFWLLFTHSLVESWCLWRTQSRTLSSLSSPLHMLYISARLSQKQPFWSAPISCRPLWVQAALWISARKRSMQLKTNLKRVFGLSSRYEIHPFQKFTVFKKECCHSLSYLCDSFVFSG